MKTIPFYVLRKSEDQPEPVEIPETINREMLRETREPWRFFYDEPPKEEQPPPPQYSPNRETVQYNDRDIMFRAGYGLTAGPQTVEPIVIDGPGEWICGDDMEMRYIPIEVKKNILGETVTPPDSFIPPDLVRLIDQYKKDMAGSMGLPESLLKGDTEPEQEIKIGQVWEREKTGEKATILYFDSDGDPVTSLRGATPSGYLLSAYSLLSEPEQETLRVGDKVKVKRLMTREEIKGFEYWNTAKAIQIYEDNKKILLSSIWEIKEDITRFGGGYELNGELSGGIPPMFPAPCLQKL